MAILERNIQGLTQVKISPWRKISFGSWRIVGDSSVYAMAEINVGPALEHIKQLSTQHSGTKLTLTHYVALALARTFHDHPEINSFIRFGKLYRRKEVDVFVHVAMDENGDDLSGVVLRNLGQRSLWDLSQEMNQRVLSLRSKGDPSFNKLKSLIPFIPSPILRYVLDATGFILYSLNLWSPLLNVNRDPFGSAMVTNIGSLGADFALTPIARYSRTPLILSIGAVKLTPVVNPQTKAIEVAEISRMGITFDHRIIDGVHGAKMSKTFRKYMEEPGLLDSP